MEMNDSALTVDQLDALSRAVPDDQERKDIRLYLQACMRLLSNPANMTLPGNDSFVTAGLLPTTHTYAAGRRALDTKNLT